MLSTQKWLPESIAPAHSMITKCNLILRGSHFCENSKHYYGSIIMSMHDIHQFNSYYKVCIRYACTIIVTFKRIDHRNINTEARIQLKTVVY